MCSDKRQRGTTANIAKTCAFLHEVRFSCSSTVVRSTPVLGQAHTPRRRLFPLALVALAVLIAPSVGGANPSQSTASLRAQDAAADRDRSCHSRRRSRASDAPSGVERYVRRGGVMVLFPGDHQQLSAAQSKLGSLRAQAQTLRAQRMSLRHQLAVAKRSTRISQARVAQCPRMHARVARVEPTSKRAPSASLPVS